jgi:hypothetical protein
MSGIESREAAPLADSTVLEKLRGGAAASDAPDWMQVCQAYYYLSAAGSVG